MVSTMRAERFYADTKTPAVEDIPIPEPGPGEMLVKVAYCGICHSDLSLINGTFPPQRPVMTSSRRGVGMSAESPSVGPTSMFGLTQKHVLGHLGYQNVDIETLATLVSMGRLDLSRSISDIVSLEDVRVGIETLERQEGNPIRILVKP
jgi:threonine dehydrogenase-like Zn-dependent dehydrogenase